MIRRSVLSLGLASLVLTLTACPDGGGGGGGTETDGSTGAGTGTTGGPTSLDSTGDSGSEGSTGEPAGVDLMPCDPADPSDEGAGACDVGECAGSPYGGYHCRPGCSSMAEPGTPCGSDDVCLPVTPGSEQTACFDVGECDFVTGEGCSGADEHCVVVSVDPLYTACVPAGDAGPGQTCDPAGMLDCGPGLACLGGNAEAGLDGVCTGWCEPGGASPADCPSCAEIGDGIGICSECTVLGDDCPAGTQCQLANELLGGECVGVGDGGLGSPCSPLEPTLSCQEGLLCVDLDPEVEGNSICLVPCDPTNPMCAGEGETCVDMSVLTPGAPNGQLGACLALGVTVCDPAMMPSTCGPGENCLHVGGGVGLCGAVCDPAEGGMACEGNFACFPSDGTEISFGPFAEGNGACGLGCSTDVDCGGATCLHLDGIESEGLCGATCTPGMAGACPGGQTCVATPENAAVGACMPGGTNCNPNNLGECGGGACINREGELLIGICLPSCFEQDPGACGGTPALCQSKTDPFWHEGTCVGGGEPCSLVQDDCGPGQACGVIGGAAFGGQAFLCDEAGPLGPGDACTPDDDQCGAGVGCVGGVCRQWCDPLAPACAAGACVDVSQGLYLPPNTLGACV